jgi:phage major head subunit gpT-like protein
MTAPLNEQTPGLNNAMNTSFNAAFSKGFETMPPQWPEIAMLAPSNKSREVYSWLGALSGMKEWIGNRRIGAYKSYGMEIRNRKFEATMRVPIDAVEDDEWGMYNIDAQRMGALVPQHQDELVFGLLPAGFTAKGYDGATFFSAAHPVNGANASNLLNVELDATSLDTALTMLMTRTNDKGKIMKLGGRAKLIVPPQLRKQALSLVAPLAVVAGQDPNTFGVTDNINRDAMTVVVAPNLFNHPKWWYVIDDTQPPLRPFVFQMRRPPRFRQKTADTDDNVFDRDEYVYGVDYRGNAGFAIWQMAIGSNPA